MEFWRFNVWILLSNVEGARVEGCLNILKHFCGWVLAGFRVSEVIGFRVLGLRILTSGAPVFLRPISPGRLDCTVQASIPLG